MVDTAQRYLGMLEFISRYPNGIRTVQLRDKHDSLTYMTSVRSRDMRKAFIQTLLTFKSSLISRNHEIIA